MAYRSKTNTEYVNLCTPRAELQDEFRRNSIRVERRLSNQLTSFDKAKKLAVRDINHESKKFRSKSAKRRTITKVHEGHTNQSLMSTINYVTPSEDRQFITYDIAGYKNGDVTPTYIEINEADLAGLKISEDDIEAESHENVINNGDRELTDEQIREFQAEIERRSARWPTSLHSMRQNKDEYLRALSAPKHTTHVIDVRTRIQREFDKPEKPKREYNALGFLISGENFPLLHAKDPKKEQSTALRRSKPAEHRGTSRSLLKPATGKHIKRVTPRKKSTTTK